MTDLVDRLLTAISAKRKWIVVIGDVMVDRWVHGRLHGSCQDHCAKFVQESVVEVPGGAANARRCLSRWGVQTQLYGVAENDCPVKTRYVEDGNIVFRTDDDGGRHVEDEYEWAREMALEMVLCAGGVLLSDYDKGFLTPLFLRNVVALCTKRGIPCVADCKRAPELYTGCVMKCNRDYQRRHNQALARAVYPAPGRGSEDADYGQPLVVTTEMDNPIVWDGNGPYGLGYDLPPVKCVNHVGAGDCFGAHLTLALAYGFILKEAAALAHSAGRAYVQHPHNRPPTPAEIVADLASVSLVAAS